MAELKRYLYNGLNFTVNTGFKPVIVNDRLINVKQKIPRTIWDIDFGQVDNELKNAIESTVLLDINDTFIKTYVGPAFYIGKLIDPITAAISYYITYVFEYNYYKKFLNKPLSYTVSGTNHIIEDTIVIPANQLSTDPKVVISEATNLPRKLFYQKDKIGFLHATNGLFKMKLSFVEQGKPLVTTEAFIVGESNDNYNNNC